MRYLSAFFCTFVIAIMGYASLIPALGPTPVSAEYWVQELLVIKRDIVKKYAGTKKIIIASGSSTLFSIDAQLLTERLGMPVINLGLMGGMPLARILEEAAAAARPKDILLLALEPEYYCREETTGFDEWVLRNAIAWDHTYWRQLGVIERVTAIRQLGLKFPLDMLIARFDQAFRPATIQPRLDALDEATVLRKFSNPPAIADNLYSVFKMSPYGDIKNTSDSNYSGTPRRADQLIKICAESFDKLSAFVSQQRSNDVSVFFLNTPYVEVDGLDSMAVETESNRFTAKLSALAPVIDDRQSLIFNRSLFLNSELHLNSLGRTLRTEQLFVLLRKLIETP
jgi:hypothetical protein